jgi:hypothetical protein
MMMLAATEPSGRLHLTKRFCIASRRPSQLSPCSVGFIALLGRRSLQEIPPAQDPSISGLVLFVKPGREGRHMIKVMAIGFALQ